MCLNLATIKIQYNHLYLINNIHRLIYILLYIIIYDTYIHNIFILFVCNNLLYYREYIYIYNIIYISDIIYIILIYKLIVL